MQPIVTKSQAFRWQQAFRRVSCVLIGGAITVCASCGGSSSSEKPYKLVKPYEDETYSNVWRERWQGEAQQESRRRASQDE